MPMATDKRKKRDRRGHSKGGGKGQGPRLRRQERSKFGHWAHAKLERMDISLRRFAEQHGESPQNLSAMLRAGDPRLSSLVKLAGMFDLTVSRLLSEVDRWEKSHPAN